MNDVKTLQNFDETKLLTVSLMQLSKQQLLLAILSNQCSDARNKTEKVEKNVIERFPMKNAVEKRFDAENSKNNFGLENF